MLYWVVNFDKVGGFCQVGYSSTARKVDFAGIEGGSGSRAWLMSFVGTKMGVLTIKFGGEWWLMKSCV